jgi:hypothetical protein
MEKSDPTLIQSQDLEHQPDPESRVSNKGVKVQPPSVDSPADDREEKEADDVVEEFERSVREQVPG